MVKSVNVFVRQVSNIQRLVTANVFLPEWLGTFLELENSTLKHVNGTTIQISRDMRNQILLPSGYLT